MPCTDPIADFLTVVRNASRAKKDKVTVPASNVTIKIGDILKNEGFIEQSKVFTEGKKRFLRIHMKYLRGKQPVIRGIRRISKPGIRIYSGYEKLPRVQGGLGVAIVSTSKGIISDREARQNKLGGELLCTVW